MTELRYTLLCDGSTDRALLPLLTWLLQQQGVGYAIQAEWTDLREVGGQSEPLAARLVAAVDLFPCDLLFVHRDAEREPHAKRLAQIHAAAAQQPALPPVVGVVPMRMQEAWLLFDEQAIRQAAGNPNGKQALMLPSLTHLEELPDPKVLLHNLLREASGLSGRRRREVPVSHYATRIPEMIGDFSPLRRLTAFQTLEADVAQIVAAQGWRS